MSNPDVSTRLKAYRLVTDGEKMITEEDYRKAVDKITEAIELFPKYSAAYYYRGLAYYGMGDYPKALDDVNQAIKLNSKISTFSTIS